MNTCQMCGIPADASFFDESNIVEAPKLGQERVLARYELHRNHAGLLLYFAQFTSASSVVTPGYQWQIRCNGQPRDPYLTFEHIINPWGMSGFPIGLRLEEGCLLEFVIRNVSVNDDPNDPAATERRLAQVGGRILGRYWYNVDFGGAPGRL
jgi:hypothetical protein